MLPATVALPVRAEPLVFCVHETVTLPGPVPLDADTLSHESVAEAVQAPATQPVGTPVRFTCCEPDDAVAVVDVGEIVNDVHTAAFEMS